MNGMLTVKQVANRLDVNKATVYFWLNSRKLTGYKAGHLWRITEQQLQDFLTREQGDGQEAVKQAIKPTPYQ